ncbi:MAG: ATPase [Bacteroidetes bacterium]|nr:ATPase [Bacteroidota bacterium]MDE2673090.1 ATPase [Bacteroidota bacterium]
MSEQQHTFAQFWKCALQVNPHEYSAQYRGTDHGMDAKSYAQAVRETCLAEEIQVVGLADHGSVDQTKTIRGVLVNAGIVVFPGFEVATTEKIHWVCLFPESTSEQQLERYLGVLKLTDPEERVRPSSLGGEELLHQVATLGGFCFAAHATSNSGILKKKFNNLWISPELRAAQIPGNVDDLPPKYKSIVLNKNPEYKRLHPMAVINAKDVAKPDDLRDRRASIFVKMTRPCFASFLMAFKDPEVRIRLSDDQQERFYSRIESVSIEGGYFDGLSAKISDHLNTVIGGRGSGKSTLLECLRYAIDVSHKSADAIKQGDEIVRENLGKAGGRVVLQLRSAVNHMKPYKVSRRFGEPPRVIDENNNESSLHPGKDLLPNIEIYGQNELYELARSPGALARLLDRFLPESAEQQAQLNLGLRNLRKNSARLNSAQEKKDEINRSIAQLPKLEEQVRQFEEQGLEEMLKQVPLLEKERQLGPRIRNEVQRTRDAHRHFEESLPDFVFLSDQALENLPHAELLRRGRTLLDSLRETLRQKLREMEQAITKTERSVENLASSLSQALHDAETELEKDFARLPAVAGMTGREIGHSYKRLLREIEQVRPLKNRLKIVDALIDELKQDRLNLLGEISDVRSARTAAKQKAVKSLNKRLDGKLQISIVPGGLRQPLREFLQDLPGIGKRKTEWVDGAQDLTVMGLVTAIREGKTTLLDKRWGLTPSIAETLTRMTPEQVYELEAIDLEDRVGLELNISHTSTQYRALDRLSTGQQCTAILHLLLLDNQDPLVVDQPEDNLDNAFIVERIVQELRAAKTERQFLFATHNANIPVFGDAEWIGVCSASESHGKMPLDAQGSIDMPAIRDQVANILEGGKEAFMQRKEKYGFDD